ncbi:MAG: hypothetical protein K2P81_03560 [Bacteriovoracaceae bacterium]|nr:hypothetical protein [Bacteriovoracaceae bacterium]
MLLAFQINAFAGQSITQAEVISAQEAWGDGIVKIGEVYLDGGDYVEAASNHIKKHYNYDNGTVMFKPTLASVEPFRPTFDSALSYFVGGNARYSEDTGFAIKPWTNVRFDNHKILLKGNMGIAMGHYYFTNLEGKETKVEYTLGFMKSKKGIKIFLQDSSLPYKP